MLFPETSRARLACRPWATLHPALVGWRHWWVLCANLVAHTFVGGRETILDMVKEGEVPRDPKGGEHPCATHRGHPGLQGGVQEVGAAWGWGLSTGEQRWAEKMGRVVHCGPQSIQETEAEASWCGEGVPAIAEVCQTQRKNRLSPPLGVEWGSRQAGRHPPPVCPAPAQGVVEP